MDKLIDVLTATTAMLMAAAALVGAVGALIVKARNEISEFKREFRKNGMDSALRNTAMTVARARALREKGKA